MKSWSFYVIGAILLVFLLMLGISCTLATVVIMFVDLDNPYYWNVCGMAWLSYIFILCDMWLLIRAK